MIDDREYRFCNKCGERWPDTGAFECPYCDSKDTEIEEDEFDGEEYD